MGANTITIDRALFTDVRMHVAGYPPSKHRDDCLAALDAALAKRRAAPAIPERKVVSQCPSSQYAQGWNAAVAAMKGGE